MRKTRLSSFSDERKSNSEAGLSAEFSTGKPGTWQRLRRLFVEAIEIDTAQRRLWLGQRSAGDDKVARELGSLLDHDDPRDQFLEKPAWRFNDGSTEPLPKRQDLGAEPGTQIGSWEVVREISSGGMGTVYLAERLVNEGESRKQRAAIKVIRNRVDPELFAARFRRERQILAGLNHPFIARFLEGGTFENGLPYFAVDYIEGEPIKEYCRHRRLPFTEILELFCDVCSAVAYAHRNLVVHRDLKPSNILVAADGAPRLIDFGIAKVLVGEGSEESLEQTIGIGPCTPNYCSPEQIRGEGVTTATDVFALGIILFELVTGAHPFVASDNAEPPAAFEVLRRICEEEPRMERAVHLDSYSGLQLKGDLGSIVLKALQKKPAERYSSVEYLIDDIQSFLHHRPVLARPQSWWYRSHRLIRRHPTAAVSISLVLIVGMVALGFILTSDRTAKQERDYALQQRELAAAAARAMIDTLASSLENMSAPIERRLELLNKAVPIFDEIDGSGRGEFDPASGVVQIRAKVQTQLILASALHEMGDTQGAMGRVRAAELLGRKLVGLSGASLDDQFLLLRTLLETCRIGSESGCVSTDEALAEAIATLRGLEKRNDLTADSLCKLDILLCNALVLNVETSDYLADPQASLRLLTLANEYGTRAYRVSPSSSDSVDAYAKSLEELGSFYVDWGKPRLFLEPVRKALAIRRKAADNAPGDIRLRWLKDRALGRWGSLLTLAGSPNEGTTIPGEELSILRQLCACDPNNVDLATDLVRELGNYGTEYIGRRQLAEAIKLFQEAVDVAERFRGKGIEEVRIDGCAFDYAFSLSVAYRRMGDIDSAKMINLKVLEPLARRLEALGFDKFRDRWIQAALCIAQAEVADGIGNWTESERLFSQALDYLRQEIPERDYPAERAFYGCYLTRYGKTLCDKGDIKSGSRYIEEGLQLMYDLQESDDVMNRDDLLNDISEAEKDLEDYRQRSLNDHNTIASRGQ